MRYPRLLGVVYKNVVVIVVVVVVVVVVCRSRLISVGGVAPLHIQLGGVLKNVMPFHTFKSEEVVILLNVHYVPPIVTKIFNM